MKKILQWLFVGVALMVLVACGGGGNLDGNTPNIYLIGERSIEINLGGNYSDPGAYATDDKDGNVTVDTSGSVNTKKEGTYTIVYSAQDSAGNKATAERIVIVRVDNKLSQESDQVEKITIDAEGEVLAVKNEILVYLKEEVTKAQYNNILKESIKYGEVLGFDKELRTLHIRVNDEKEEISVIESLKKIDGVEYASLNRIEEYSSTNINIKPLLSHYPMRKLQSIKMARLAPSNFAGDYWIEHINIKKAWNIEKNLSVSDANVTIGIVDTGIPKKQTIVNESRLTRYNTSGIKIDDDDTFVYKDHGAWVVAFASGDKNNTIGVSRYSKVLSIDDMSKVCKFSLSGTCIKEGTSSLKISSGLRTAIEKGADIINLSAGPRMKCNDNINNKATVRSRFRARQTNFVRLAKRENALVTFSSGNACEKHDDDLLPERSSTEASLAAWNENTIIVGASNSNYQDADFSLMGKVVGLLAPGDNVGVNNEIRKNKATNSGTSFAAPIVAGSSAIIKGINHTLLPVEIKKILIDSADPKITFFDMNKSKRVRENNYTNATEPNLLLNAGKAAEQAKDSRKVPLNRLSEIILDGNKSIDVNVTVPESTVKMLDIVFLIDVSGSYNDDIESLKNSANAIISELKEKDIDIQFGVASFADFPIYPYGDKDRDDKAYYLNQAITNDINKIKASIENLNNPLKYGGDTPESQLEALYQVATGNGLDINKDGDYNDNGELSPEKIGWRPGALRIVIFATDAPFHDADDESNYPGHGKAATKNALVENGIKIIALQSGDDDDAKKDIEKIVENTKGSIYELSYDSSGIADAIADGMEESLSKIDLNIEILAGKRWIKSITPSSFKDVVPGETKTFKVEIGGLKEVPMIEIKDNLLMWILGNNSALMKRVAVPVKIPDSR